MLTWLTKSILVVFAFLFVIFIHELGHYIVCRRLKIKVAEFSIGIGAVKFLPKFTDKRGTVWRLGLLPIGGYVKPLHKEILEVNGEGFISNFLNSLDNLLTYLFRPLQQIFSLIYDPVDEKLVRGKKYMEDLKPIELICLAAAGPFINFMLSFIILFTMYSTIGRNFVQVEINSNYSQLEAGDRIISVNEVKCATLLNQYLFEEKGILKINRNNKMILLDEEQIKRDCSKFLQEEKKRLDLINAAKYSINDIGLLIKNYFLRLLNFKRVVSKIGGPIAILREGISSAVDLYSFISWVILLSLVLGVFNLLPIPPLDGGRVMLGFLHIIFPKKYHKFIDDMFNDVALLFVLILFLLIFKSDVLKGGKI